jgi:hypothetical protein
VVERDQVSAAFEDADAPDPVWTRSAKVEYELDQSVLRVLRKWKGRCTLASGAMLNV